MHISDIASEIEARKFDVVSVLTVYINESDRYVTSTSFWIYFLSFKTFNFTSFTFYICSQMQDILPAHN